MRVAQTISRNFLSWVTVIVSHLRDVCCGLVEQQSPVIPIEPGFPNLSSKDGLTWHDVSRLVGLSLTVGGQWERLRQAMSGAVRPIRLGRGFPMEPARMGERQGPSSRSTGPVSVLVPLRSNLPVLRLASAALQ